MYSAREITAQILCDDHKLGLSELSISARLLFIVVIKLYIIPSFINEKVQTIILK